MWALQSSQISFLSFHSCYHFLAFTEFLTVLKSYIPTHFCILLNTEYFNFFHLAHTHLGAFYVLRVIIFWTFFALSLSDSFLFSGWLLSHENIFCCNTLKVWARATVLFGVILADVFSRMGLGQEDHVAREHGEYKEFWKWRCPASHTRAELSLSHLKQLKQFLLLLF